MFESGQIPYGKDRHQQFIVEAERQRLVKSLPKRGVSPVTRTIKSAVIALAALISR